MKLTMFLAYLVVCFISFVLASASLWFDKPANFVLHVLTGLGFLGAAELTRKQE